MELLVNGLLTAATLFAGGYCWVLARRVHDLKSLDKGLGGSIVSLTRQVELARLTLDEARAASQDSGQDLARLMKRADASAHQLRMLIEAGPKASAAPATPSGPPHHDDNTRELAGVDQAPEAASALVPKPRTVLAVENPLRWAKTAAAEASSQSEDEILEALRALAAGVR
jgi:hypothetical protein